MSFRWLWLAGALLLLVPAEAPARPRRGQAAGPLTRCSLGLERDLPRIEQMRPMVQIQGVLRSLSNHCGEALGRLGRAAGSAVGMAYFKRNEILGKAAEKELPNCPAKDSMELTRICPYAYREPALSLMSRVPVEVATFALAVEIALQAAARPETAAHRMIDILLESAGQPQ
jgi:hypothetical protein